MYNLLGRLCPEAVVPVHCQLGITSFGSFVPGFQRTRTVMSVSEAPITIACKPLNWSS